MKFSMLLIGTLLLAKVSNAQILKGIQIFYHDKETTKGKDVYRELKGVGDDADFSKPESIDVVLNFNPFKISGDGFNEEIEILIEELYEPESWVKKSRSDIYNGKGWVPNKVIYSGNVNLVKSNKITVKNVLYQTAYFLSSIQYNKVAFRLVGVYRNTNNNKTQIVKKEIYFE